MESTRGQKRRDANERPRGRAHHLPMLISAFLAGEENGQKMFPPPHRNLFLLALTSISSARMMEMFLLLDEYQTFSGLKSGGAS
mgnify:CR=1 FL=1